MRLVAMALLASAALSCSAPRSAEVVLRPLEERRARAIIERVVRESGHEPRPGRVFELPNGYRLQEDALISEGPYGVAYLTSQEIADAGDGLPKNDPDLPQLRGKKMPDGAVLLLLYQQNYRFDAGANHTITAVAAEAKLERDVADFMAHVVETGSRR